MSKNKTFKDTNNSFANFLKQPHGSCEDFVDQIISIVLSPEFQSRDHLAGYLSGLAISIANVELKINVTGFKNELVVGGQDADVIRHIMANAAASMTGGNLFYIIHFIAQSIDHYDYTKPNKKVESIAEMKGNLAGAKVGDAINRVFNRIKYSRESEKKLAISLLRSELKAILCQ